MSDLDETMLYAVVFVVIVAGIFTIVFGLGEVHGREEYKNELHQQLKENNRLLKENIALIEKMKEVVE